MVYPIKTPNRVGVLVKKKNIKKNNYLYNTPCLGFLEGDGMGYNATCYKNDFGI